MPDLYKTKTYDSVVRNGDCLPSENKFDGGNERNMKSGLAAVRGQVVERPLASGVKIRTTSARLWISIRTAIFSG
jgi:hypothetical protein